MSKSQRELISVAQAILTTNSVPPTAHTAESLVAEHGAVTQEQVAAYVGPGGSSAVVEQGQRASASRLADDGVRMVGEASDFLRTATARQRSLLAVIDTRFLAGASGALLYISQRKTKASQRNITVTARKAGAKRALVNFMASGRAMRDAYAVNLVAACGNDTSWRARMSATVVAVDSPEELAGSIDAMAAEGRALQRHLADEKRETFLTNAYLDEMVSYADELRARGNEANGVVDAATAARGDLVWWQGACVWFLSTLVSVFGRAHAADAAVPKITPRQLRAVLQPHKTRKKSAKKPEAKEPAAGKDTAAPNAPAKPAPDA
jgi:hypothetical protein